MKKLFALLLTLVMMTGCLTAFAQEEEGEFDVILDLVFDLISGEDAPEEMEDALEDLSDEGEDALIDVLTMAHPWWSSLSDEDLAAIVEFVDAISGLEPEAMQVAVEAIPMLDDEAKDLTLEKIQESQEDMSQLEDDEVMLINFLMGSLLDSLLDMEEEDAQALAEAVASLPQPVWE